MFSGAHTPPHERHTSLSTNSSSAGYKVEMAVSLYGRAQAYSAALPHAPLTHFPMSHGPWIMHPTRTNTVDVIPSPAPDAVISPLFSPTNYSPHAHTDTHTWPRLQRSRSVLRAHTHARRDRRGLCPTDENCSIRNILLIFDKCVQCCL